MLGRRRTVNGGVCVDDFLHRMAQQSNPAEQHKSLLNAMCLWFRREAHLQWRSVSPFLCHHCQWHFSHLQQVLREAAAYKSRFTVVYKFVHHRLLLSFHQPLLSLVLRRDKLLDLAGWNFPARMKSHFGDVSQVVTEEDNLLIDANCASVDGGLQSDV